MVTGNDEIIVIFTQLIEDARDQATIAHARETDCTRRGDRTLASEDDGFDNQAEDNPDERFKSHRIEH